MNSRAGGMCGGPLSQRGWLDGLSNGGGGVLRALMFPRQETPSPSCTLYLFACSPIFIRLYLRLESVPLHFLLRSSSSFSSLSSSRRQPPSIAVSRHSTFSPPGTDAVTTTCKHSGICNSNAAKRGRKATAEQPEAVRLTFRRRSRDYELFY